MSAQALQARAQANAARAKVNRLAAGGARFALPKRLRIREVMSSPPTPTVSASHTISSPKAWPVVSTTNSVVAPLHVTRRGGGLVQAGTGYPDYNFSRQTNINYGGGTLQTNAISFAYLTDAAEIEFFVKGMAPSLLFKIDGQYVSLTPTTTANDGGLYYVYLSLGSVALREIELIGNSATRLGGVFTPATASLVPVKPRGPRLMVLGDSFCEGTGATTVANMYVQYMADALGWDDVWPSGVGATGLLAGPNPKLKYRDRIATDIVPFVPDIVIIQGSQNDNGQTASAIQAEMIALVGTLQAAMPNTVIVLTSMWQNKGVGNTPTSTFVLCDTLKATAASLGLPYIDLTEHLLPVPFTPQTVTLASAASANATSLSLSATPTPGTYRFADGTRVFIRSMASTIATIDNLATAQASGATLTQIGSSLWYGSGKMGTTTGVGNCDLIVSSDGTHPTDAGHALIGNAMAAGLMAVLGR